jgi:hypothetical protein
MRRCELCPTRMRTHTHVCWSFSLRTHCFCSPFAFLSIIYIYDTANEGGLTVLVLHGAACKHLSFGNGPLCVRRTSMCGARAHNRATALLNRPTATRLCAFAVYVSAAHSCTCMRVRARVCAPRHMPWAADLTQYAMCFDVCVSR